MSGIRLLIPTFVYPQYLWLLLIVPILAWIGWLGRQRLSRIRFWSSLALRSVVYTLLVCALAGMQLRLKSNILTTVFILDASDSIPRVDQAHGEAMIRQSLEKMRGEDQAAVIVFGEDAVVERLASISKNLQDISSVPVATRTDIANALQLAQAIFPGEGAKRIVLLSDGRENLGAALEQAEIAAASHIQLLFFPLGGQQGQVEVWLDSLEAPAEVRQGQEFVLKAALKTSKPVDATIRIFENDRLIQSIETHLTPKIGDAPSIFQIPVKSPPPAQDGVRFLRYRVQVLPAEDTRLQNNEASAFTIVHGPPSVLIVEGQTGYADNLMAALAGAQMHIQRATPQAMPTTLAQLANYDSLILVDTPANELPTGVIDILPGFVRDLGKGLLVIGGPHSYGAGGYLRTPLEKALPVDMDIRDKNIQSNLALVLAVDKSGSMGRCHCDNPDLFQSYTPSESGQAKVDIAKEAIMRAASAVGDQDYLGVLAFDSQPHWVLELKQLVDPYLLEQAIGSFQAEGQTNLQAGVQAAYDALRQVQARRKHLILMTDGWVRQGDLNPLAQRMEEEGITLSIVAAGEGAGAYLNALAQTGGGKFYPARSIQDVPDIFLKETIQSVGKYVIEEPFYPIPAGSGGSILRGIDVDQLPPLFGYNGVSAKNTARLELITARGDPLLATWQFGLGRAATWMSDLKGQWAKEWLKWAGYPRFVTQLVNWTLPAPRAEGLSAAIKVQEDQAIIQIEAAAKDGAPLNFLTGVATILDPKLNKTELALKQTGAGQYQAIENVSLPGVYLARVGLNNGDQSLGQITLGFVVPYSPEFRSNGLNLGLLDELARLTRGKEITANQFELAFEHEGLVSVDSAREMWLSLLILAALLFPVDVAVRRLTIRKKELIQAADWIKARLPRKTPAPASQPKLLTGLFAARQRARQHVNIPPTQNLNHAGETSFAVENNPVQSPKALHPSSPEEQTSAPDPEPKEKTGFGIDPLSRLRQAKKRARR